MPQLLVRPFFSQRHRRDPSQFYSQLRVYQGKSHEVLAILRLLGSQRSRRQQVMPEQKPSSVGIIRHGIPVMSTNNMPVSAMRLSTARDRLSDYVLAVEVAVPLAPKIRQ